jgi:hypothetical protein
MVRSRVYGILAGYELEGRWRFRSRQCGCAGGGVDRGRAAASLPAAAAARPAGRGAALHLAQAAHQGGGGSHCADTADRAAALSKLATPGLVSPCMRARACPRPASRAATFWLTRWAARCGTSTPGGKGAVCLRGRARPNRSAQLAGDPWSQALRCAALNNSG